MRTLATFVLLALLMGMQPCWAKANGQEAMEKIKSLAGEWVGKSEDDGACTLKYEPTSAGTAILETLKPGKHPEMLSIYHMDGDHILLTHFCSLANQPRMKVEDYDPAANTMKFDFMDITNLKDKDAPHITGLTLSFIDKDHLVQKWSFAQGADVSSTTFTFERKK